MIRDITEESIPDLDWLDYRWNRARFAEALGVPGAGGLISDKGFILGVIVEDELFVTRMRLPTSEEVWGDMLVEIRRRWKKIHHDVDMELIGVKLKDPDGDIAELVDAGWVPSLGHGMMKMRLTLSVS